MSSAKKLLYLITLMITFALPTMAKSVDNLLTQDIYLLLDKPFFKMYEMIKNKNLVPEIKRRAALSEAEGGLNAETKNIAEIALAEYFIAIRDFHQSRQALAKIDPRTAGFQNLKNVYKARYYSAKGVSMGYLSSDKKNSQSMIRQALVDFDIAENIFKTDPFQTEELFRTYFNKARHYLWLGETENAFQYIRKAERVLPIIKQDGYKSAYYFIRGNIELEQKAYQSAKNDFKKSRFFMNDLFKQQNMPELIEASLEKIKQIEAA